jgi:HTH-type transcriptional regulator/antitoxin HigA
MLKAIYNEDDYNFAMAEVARLWGAEPGSQAQGELEVWGILIDAYEHTLIKPARLDPVEVIKAEMDMSGRTKADLAAIIRANRVSEILERRRPLTLAMIRAISETWGVPADLLIADYVTSPPAAPEGRRSGRPAGRSARPAERTRA